MRNHLTLSGSQFPQLPQLPQLFLTRTIGESQDLKPSTLADLNPLIPQSGRPLSLPGSKIKILWIASIQLKGYYLAIIKKIEINKYMGIEIFNSNVM